VLKLQVMAGGQKREEEHNREVRGVLVDATGLIVTANSHFDLPPQVRRAIRGRSDLNVKASAKDVKVLFGTEEKEFDSRLVARESNLGLAFVQILDLAGHEAPSVNLDDAGTLAIGVEAVGVSRLGRGFDCAPSIARVFVHARVEKPRTMWAITGEFDELGHVVFDRAGKPLGIVSLQEGSEGVSDAGGMFGGAENFAVFILPAETIARTCKRALERGKEAIEKAKAGEDEEFADKPAEEKPADAPKDGDPDPDGDDDGCGEADHDEDDAKPEPPPEPKAPKDG
jgi:hypothetical protein